MAMHGELSASETSKKQLCLRVAFGVQRHICGTGASNNDNNIATFFTGQERQLRGKVELNAEDSQSKRSCEVETTACGKMEEQRAEVNATSLQQVASPPHSLHFAAMSNACPSVEEEWVGGNPTLPDRVSAFPAPT
ncbi:hypothetical protein TSMEX_003362 [Taenia solium]|eukprot:TsM_000526300 transcript=TsM_000526300 gene=TsM_000526300